MIKYMIKCNSNATKPVKSRVSGCFDFALEVPLEIALENPLEKYKCGKLKKDLTIYPPTYIIGDR